MLYRKIIAVCSQIHTQQTNTLCGQNAEFVNFKRTKKSKDQHQVKHGGT
jgi:hypothetical protein